MSDFRDRGRKKAAASRGIAAGPPAAWRAGMRWLVVVVGGAVVAGCGGPPVVDSPCPSAVALTEVQTRVFDHCGGDAYGPGCHVREPFGANLDLRHGHAWRDLVHVESQSSQSKFLVEPGDPAHSFLWQKLNGWLAGDGSEGVAMPRDTSDHWAPLPEPSRAAVRCWIASGAPNN